MSALNCGEKINKATYASTESLESNAYCYSNGAGLLVPTTTVSGFKLNKVGEISFNSSLSSATIASNMAIKREFQDDESSCTDDSASSLDWQPSSKALKIAERAVDYSVTSPNYTNSGTGTANSSNINSGSRRSLGSRRNDHDERLSPEEVERKRQRRERNKVAAAKCRQKRVDLTNQLLSETKSLEEEQSLLKDKIKSYQQEKEELEFVLEAHRVHCGAGIQPPPAVQEETKDMAFKARDLEFPQVATSKIPESAVVQRPNTIPITKAAVPMPSSVAVAEVTNVQTPILSSGVFVLGLQSMINGHTGLTPVTGLPSEIVPTSQSFSSEDGVASAFGLSSNSKLLTL